MRAAVAICGVVALQADAGAQEVAGQGISLSGLKGQYQSNKPFATGYTMFYMPPDEARKSIDLSAVQTIAGAVAGIVVYGCNREENDGRIIYKLGRQSKYTIRCDDKPINITSSLRKQGNTWVFSGKLATLDRFSDGRPYEKTVVTENFKLALSQGGCTILSFRKIYAKDSLISKERSVSKYWSVPGSKCEFR